MIELMAMLFSASMDWLASYQAMANGGQDMNTGCWR